MFTTSLPATRAVPAFLLALLAGIALLVFLDVQVSVAAIDPSNPTTWPNMAPQIRYLFIPVFFIITLLFTAIADPLLRGLLALPSLAKPWQYAALGFSYSTLLASPLVARFVEGPGLIAGPVLAVLLAALVRHRARAHAS